ncbi:hypothetical protein AA313_de0207981 [Arthrobotrys entomopaga]|nr:hypothetical protein AA313_de0207981 [Arthrobotrys entomopaga]
MFFFKALSRPGTRAIIANIILPLVFFISQLEEVSASKGDEPTPGKVGTLSNGINGVHDVICIVKPGSRRSYDKLEHFDLAFISPKSSLSHMLQAPKKYSVYRLESKTLGVYAYYLNLGVYRRALGVRDDIEQYSKKNSVTNVFSSCLGFTPQSLHGLEEINGKRWYDFPPDSFPDYKEFERPIPQGLLTASTPRHRQNLQLGQSKNQIEVIRPALSELSVLSWPKQNDLVKEPVTSSYYRYQNALGRSTVVYIIDSAFDLTHPELENINLQDWIDIWSFPPGRDNYEIYETLNYHGSVIAAKIAGQRTGIAPDARIVFLPFLDGTKGAPLGVTLSALLKVYDHIKAVNSNSPCVINMAFSLPLDRTGSEGFLYYAYKDIITRLSELPNVVMVTAAGNEGKGKPIDTVPQVIGKNMKNFITVGAVGMDFQNTGQFDASFTNFVWAPSDNITFIQPFDPRKDPSRERSLTEYLADYYLPERDGSTSIAAATVSGMLATYLSRNLGSKSAIKDAVAQLKSLSVVRVEGGPPIITNGITPSQWPKEDQKAVGYSPSIAERVRCFLTWNKKQSRYDCDP